MAKKRSEKSENKRESSSSSSSVLLSSSRLKMKKKECPNNNNKAKAKEAAKQNKAKAEKMEAEKAQLWLKLKCEEEERRIARFVEYGLPMQLRLKKEKNEQIMKEFLNIGYVFNPAEDKLLDYHLRNKIMDKPMDFCPIKEVDVYANHPRTLIGKSGVLYFFTHSRPNEIQPSTQTDVQGHWIFGEKTDVFNQGEKVGVKQVVEYCEAGGHKSEYKIIEYQLDPAPDDMKTGPWFVCKLDTDGSCVDVHSGP